MTPFEPFERSRPMGQKIDMPLARFAIGDVVRHRLFDFRGVIFDVDPVFANSEEWYEAIPEELRPPRTSLSTICSPKMPRAATSLMSASRTCCPTTATSRSTIRPSPTMFDGFGRRPLPAAAGARHYGDRSGARLTLARPLP